jgi:hypothetical protein
LQRSTAIRPFADIRDENRIVRHRRAKFICGPRVIAERARAVDSAAIGAIVVWWLAPSEV